MCNELMLSLVTVSGSKYGHYNLLQPPVDYANSAMSSDGECDCGYCVECILSGRAYGCGNPLCPSCGDGDRYEYYGDYLDNLCQD
jgi:hypothetical protein